MYVGIDFGTTFSQISTLYLEQPTLLLSPGEYGIPSEFYYDQESGILLGQDALDAGQGIMAKNLKSEVKMDLKNNFIADGRTFKSSEIVSEFYKSLIIKGQHIAKTKAINEEIEGAVISVPAKFTMQERNLIYEAAKNCIPGKEIFISDIIKEPVAAALSYYKTDLPDNKYVLVYDLGGGTCDIALVKSDRSLVESFDVIDTDMLRIGGRNWDRELIDYIEKIVENKVDMEVKCNPGYEEKIRRAAILVKQQLSDPTKNRAIARIEVNGRIISIPVTLSTFNEITSSLLNKTLDCVQAMYDKHIGSCEIEEIICVGGSSNMLQIEEGLKDRFHDCNIRLYEPEHAVVNGATIYANLIKKSGNQKTFVKDIASFSYGVRCFRNFDVDPNDLIIANIIVKGDVLPRSCDHGFSTVEYDQERITFAVYESEYTDEDYDFENEDKKYIGEVNLTLPPNSKKGLNLNCIIKLNTKGLLEITASEPSGNKIQGEFKLEDI